MKRGQNMKKVADQCVIIVGLCEEPVVESIHNKQIYYQVNINDEAQ